MKYYIIGFLAFRVNLFASDQSQTVISSSLTIDSNNGNDLSLYKRLVSSAKRKNSNLLEEAEISLIHTVGIIADQEQILGVHHKLLLPFSRSWFQFALFGTSLFSRYEQNHLFMTPRIPKLSNL